MAAPRPPAALFPRITPRPPHRPPAPASPAGASGPRSRAGCRQWPWPSTSGWLALVIVDIPVPGLDPSVRCAPSGRYDPYLEMGPTPHQPEILPIYPLYSRVGSLLGAVDEGCDAAGSEWGSCHLPSTDRYGRFGRRVGVRAGVRVADCWVHSRCHVGVQKVPPIFAPSRRL